MITIMTPTYNRAYILPNLYDSLCNQTVHDFEWVVIDDGSTDNTEELVAGWLKKQNPFDIVYVKKQNGGKHRAINYAVKIAKYDWFFIVDSDDFITPDAVMLIHEWIKTVAHDTTFAGVSGLRGYINFDKPIGEPLNVEYVDATNLEREKFNLSGDKAEIYRTDILKKFPFPEYEGEKFITEAVVWDEIALNGYKLRWFNKIIYKCEYLEDGLTQSGDKIFHDNFEGYTHYIKMQIAIKKSEGMRDAILHYYGIAKKKGLATGQIRQKLDIPMPNLYALLIKGHLIKLLKKNQMIHKTARAFKNFVVQWR